MLTIAGGVILGLLLLPVVLAVIVVVPTILIGLLVYVFGTCAGSLLLLSYKCESQKKESKLACCGAWLLPKLFMLICFAVVFVPFAWVYHKI